MKFKLLLLLSVFFQIGYAQINISGKETSIVLPSNFSFTHPMTVTYREEVEIVKTRIANGIEPQATAYAKLIKIADKKLVFVPDPPETMELMGGYDPNSNTLLMRAWLWRNCDAAYASALAYAYTGDTRYADKAVEVLNAWAVKGTTFTGGDRGLQLGSYFSPMLYAADLLHDYTGWASTDRALFKTWWSNQILVHTYAITKTYYNNWLDAGVLGVMAAAVTFEDKGLLQESLNILLSYYKKNNAARMKPYGDSWKMSKDSNGVYLTTEVTREEGRKGLTYSYYSMTTAIQNLEIARYAGYNFWSAKTSTGANYQGVIEQLYKWGIEGETFPWSAKPDGNTFWYHFNSYEIANSNCQLPEAMKLWLNNNRPVIGAQGDEYVTLNKGDIFTFNTTAVKNVNNDYDNNFIFYKESNCTLNLKVLSQITLKISIYTISGMKIQELLVYEGNNLITFPIPGIYIIQAGKDRYKINL